MQKEKKIFRGFDHYLTEKWADYALFPDGVFDAGSAGDKVRENAYQRFRRALGKERVADGKTMRKWFGLGGLSKPGRERIFRIAFALKLSSSEAQSYLTEELLEPGIQLNDYRELIWLYGLDKKLDYEFCENMIRVFEQNVDWSRGISQKTHTEQIRRWYQVERDKEPEEFTAWMIENGNVFKGYSKTVLKLFVQIKDELSQMMRQEAEEYLTLLLAETGYTGAKTREEVGRYLYNLSRRKKYKEEPEKIDTIRYYFRIAYGEKDKNSHLLTEMYASAIPWGGKRRLKQKNMAESVLLTEKMLSHLLTVATQKERLMRLSQARAVLSGGEDDSCPGWIAGLITGYGGKKPGSAAEAKKRLDYQLRHQRQRCHLINRADFLPFLHQLAQKRYMKSIADRGGEYDRQEALNSFIALADSTLAGCDMIPLSPEYELDSILMGSFGEDELYSLSDMLEQSR